MVTGPPLTCGVPPSGVLIEDDSPHADHAVARIAKQLNRLMFPPWVCVGSRSPRRFLMRARSPRSDTTAWRRYYIPRATRRAIPLWDARRGPAGAARRRGGKPPHGL